MTDESYKKAYERARKEFDDLTEERDAIDRRMAELKKIITALEPHAGDEAQSFVEDVLLQVGLTEACLDVLRALNKPSTPSEVVHGLRQLYRYDMSKYANPIAVVTTTLKRSKAVLEVTRSDGKKAYIPRTGEAIRNALKSGAKLTRGKDKQ